MRILLAAIAALLGLLLGACGQVGTATDSASASSPGSPAAAVAGAAAPSASVPRRVGATLAKVDAGDWPPLGDNGTRGGRHFGNFESRLPETAASGKRIKYTEWDVNVKKPGRGRDAERIVTGSDGSAWYTLDHYETFTRIR